MPSLRSELDSIMKAELEQVPAFQETLRRRNDPDSESVDIDTTLSILLSWAGIHRRAILRLAEEIDRLNGVDEPET